MNKFENYIKNSLENYEEKFNPADWNDLEKKLNQQETTSKITKGVIFSSIAIFAIGVVLYFTNSEKQNSKTQISSSKFQTENIIPEQKTSDVKNEIPEEKQSNNQTTEQSNNIHISQNSSLKKEEKISLQEKISPKKIVKEINVSEPTLNLKPETSTSSGNSAPKANFSNDKNMICANSPVQFTTENSEIPVEYHWDFGDGNNSAEPNPKHSYKNAGTYSVKLQVISKTDKKSDLQTNTITVNPAPISDFNWKTSSGENPTLNFETNQEDIVKYEWDFGDKQNSSEEKPSHSYAKKGKYSALVTLTNNSNCTTTCRKIVNVENDFGLLAPNAFSPNGDGKNDTWMPIALLDGDYVFNLTIIDRNGQIAFKTSSKNNPWDGRHLKTNDFVKTGETFQWIAVVKEKNGTEATYGGSITITESMGY